MSDERISFYLHLFRQNTRNVIAIPLPINYRMEAFGFEIPIFELSELGALFLIHLFFVKDSAKIQSKAYFLSQLFLSE